MNERIVGYPGMKIICPACRAQQSASRSHEAQTRKIDGVRDVYWDGIGDEHVHDHSWVERDFVCSALHSFTIVIGNNCNCGWSGPTSRDDAGATGSGAVSGTP